MLSVLVCLLSEIDCMYCVWMIVVWNEIDFCLVCILFVDGKNGWGIDGGLWIMNLCMNFADGWWSCEILYIYCYWLFIWLITADVCLWNFWFIYNFVVNDDDLMVIIEECKVLDDDLIIIIYWMRMNEWMTVKLFAAKCGF